MGPGDAAAGRLCRSLRRALIQDYASRACGQRPQMLPPRLRRRTEAASEHEVGGNQGDGAGQGDVEVGDPVAVDVARNGGDTGAGEGKAQLPRDTGVEAGADEAEG